MENIKLTQEIVKELFDCDLTNGVLTWKKRDIKWFTSERECKRWNSRYAGKEALTSLARFGHKQGKLFNKVQKAHRIIWLWATGELPDQIDHINGIPGDNRLANLRNVSSQENQRNVKLTDRNKSGFVGVCFRESTKRWRANIKIDGKTIYLGNFKNIDDAINARKEANIKYGFHPNHGRIMPCQSNQQSN